MKIILALLLATSSVIAYANNSAVSVDEVEYTNSATYYKNTNLITPEIHVLGVYKPTSTWNHSQGTIFVDVVGTSNIPVNLVLSAYEPTHWILQGDGVQYIDSVLINGFYTGSVTGIANSLVINKTGLENWLGTTAYEWPSSFGGSDTGLLVREVEAFYASPISTFSGAYGASKFTVSLATIPEPESLLMLLAGLCLIGHVARRRKA
jgi:hypothetical protein